MKFAEVYLVCSMKLFVQQLAACCINTPTCTKFIWCSYYRSLIDTLASEVKCLRVIKKCSKQRAEYLQKQDGILSQENKAKSPSALQGRSRKEEGLCTRQLQGRSRKEEGLCTRQLQGRSRKEEGLCTRQLQRRY